MSDIIKPLPCVNSETNDKAMRAILDGVDYLMTKEIKDAPFDKVYTGIIKTVNSDNTYDLTIGGNLYKGVPSMFKASFAENDIVKVVSPQNQMGNIFIFGKMNMEVSGSNKVTSVAWDVISDKPSDLVQDASYTHTDNNYTTEEKNKLKAIEEGAQKNTVTGVKGDVETSYREGNVNITKANIGLDKVDNTADADKSVENASKLNNQLPSYYATAQSVADENERATIAEQENSALIDNETKRAKSVESDLSSKLTDEIERAQKAEKVNSDAIDVLNGEATVEGSVAYKIAQIVNENDNGSIDTLKEIASWIDNNPNSATAMQKQITENKSAIDTHIKNTANPHKVTKSQIGLGNVDNTSDADKPISTATQKALDLKTNLGDFNAHIQNTGNPHNVTASQVGLGNVPNVNTNDQTPTYNNATKLTALTSGEKLSVAFGKIAKAISDLINHIADTANPHKVTKSQIGLGNVSNYDQSKAIKSITRNGLTFTCTKLDGTTETFTQQDKNDNTTYTLTQDSSNGHILYFTPSNGTKQTITIPDKDTTYELASQTVSGLMSYNDKKKLDGIESGAQKNTVTGIKGDSETSYRNGNVNITKANIGLGSVSNYDQSKAIKSITRNGTTFTATALDGTTSTFTQQDNNTTYNEATTSNAGLMSASDKSKLNGIATGATANTASTVAPSNISTSSVQGSSNNYARQDHTHGIDLATGDSNGQVKIAGKNVSVKGLGTAAYTSSDIYRKSLLKCFQNSNLTNGTWYKLFTIKYTGWNYLSFRMIVKTGYQPLCEVLVSVRYTPRGIDANDSYIKIIPSGYSLDAVRMYQIDTQTIGIAAVVAGSSSDFGFEILDETSESNAIPISSFVVSNPFVALNECPTKFGVHHYITGSYTDLDDKPTITTDLTKMTGTLAIGHGGTGATTASGARTNLGIGTLGTKNVIEKGDLTLKFVNGNTLQLVNSAGTVISSMLYTPKIEWNQSTFTSYVWNE